jgi:protein gp37
MKSDWETTKNYSPWVGCVGYSTGCKSCFARLVMDTEGFHRSDTFYDLLDRDKYPAGTNVYQCLNSDFWLREADEWRAEVWDMMEERSDLSYILMTKRVSRVGVDLPRWVETADNIGFVTTIESEAAFEERWRYTHDLPFRNKLVTVGPIQEYVDLRRLLPDICQVFILGEMGDKDTVTPCRCEWVAGIVEDCREYDVNCDLLMAGSVFVDPDGDLRYLNGFDKMMEVADEFGLHHVSETKRRYHHEPSLVFEGR